MITPLGIQSLGIKSIVSISIGLPSELKAKFLFLWTGKYDGDDLQNDLDDDVITVTDKDWETKYIPETSESTFAVLDTAGYIAADTDNFWFDAEETQLQKTFTNLIESTTARTFVKYSDFEPYQIFAIGIMKAGETLTENDEYILTRYFKLWTLYFGGEMREYGYMKDNRVMSE